MKLEKARSLTQVVKKKQKDSKKLSIKGFLSIFECAFVEIFEILILIIIKKLQQIHSHLKNTSVLMVVLCGFSCLGLDELYISACRVIKFFLMFLF